MVGSAREIPPGREARPVPGGGSPWPRRRGPCGRRRRARGRRDRRLSALRPARGRWERHCRLRQSRRAQLEPGVPDPRLLDRRRRERPPGLPGARRHQQRPGVLDALVRSARQAVRARDDRLLHGRDDDRLRPGLDRRRAVLLSRRRARLHRPRLLPGAPRPLRRAGRAVRRGVRDRTRVRPPRTGPARRPRARRLAGRGEHVGANGAPGRLLRRRLGQERGRDGLHRRPDAGRCRGRARCGRRGRRRSHPAGDPRQDHRTRGRTAPPPSGRSGSRAATSAASRADATRSAARCSRQAPNARREPSRRTFTTARTR